MWIEMWILWKRERERAQHRSFYFFSVREGGFDESREERSGYVWWWYMRSLVGKWQERRDEKGKARRTGKDKDGTGQDRNRELIIFAQ